MMNVLSTLLKESEFTLLHSVSRVHIIIRYFFSEQDFICFSFLTSSRALGAQGFRITWTEVHETGTGIEISKKNISEDS